MRVQISEKESREAWGVGVERKVPLMQEAFKNLGWCVFSPFVFTPPDALLSFSFPPAVQAVPRQDGEPHEQRERGGNGAFGQGGGGWAGGIVDGASWFPGGSWGGDVRQSPTAQQP